jgi:hypothetical protein
LTHLTLEASLFLGQASRLAIITPKIRLLREVVEFCDSALFDRQVKATP